MENELLKISYNVSGPVIFNYVNWIIENCVKKNIKVLYFLARDGYILQKIAKQICKAKNININCRYLYCSRHSLRLPTYNLIGDEKFNLLLTKSYCLTLKSILKRVDIKDNKIKTIANEIEVNDINKELSGKEFEIVKNKLIKNDLFNNEIFEKSKNAYKTTIEYLKQEKVFDKNTFAFVDSGWSGSIQRSFRQLFDGEKFYPKIIGFYFGLFNKTKDEDGEFLTYYFNSKGNIRRKVNFNPVIFESFLSAPHGMTLFYKKQKNKVVPIFK